MYTEARSTFQRLIEDGAPGGVIPQEVLNVLSESQDIMPGSLCGDLDVPVGSTYGQGVKAWREASVGARQARG